MTTLTAPARLGVTTLRSRAVLPRAEEAWRLLQERSAGATVFSTWQWNSLVARHFAPGGALQIMLVDDADGPVALAPLAWRRVAGIKTLAFLGSCLRDYSRADYQDVLIEPGRDGAAVTALAGQLAREPDWQMLWLQELPESSPLLRLLPAIAQRHGWHTAIEPASDVYRVRLPDTWEAYAERLSPNMRQAAGRKTRKLQREHGASFQRVARPAELPEAMETLFELHEQRWRGEGRRSLLPKPTIFPDETTRNFHSDLARQLLADGMLDLELLRAGDEVIGARYSFEFRGTRSFYASGYHMDEAWAKYSLGLVMDMHSIQDSITRGLDYEDFLRNDGEYKQHYDPQRSDNRDLIMFRSRAAEQRFRAYRGARGLARMLVRRWR